MNAIHDLPRPMIMIVDDDPVIHKVFAKMLESFTGTVVHCHDGREALALAQELRPELIITDALMPKLDGRELTRILKQSPATRHAKIVVMTGLYKGVRYRGEAFRDFLVDAYMEKPINSGTVWSLVRSVQGKAA
jgi:CheY-like chemotaxis protein